jgi:predicted AAA+ superfamily ATPase
VVIDEVQKAPRLLEIVHQLVDRVPQRFVLTGSSARKLRRGSSDMLAGRAFVYHLHPLTHRELGDRFDLVGALRWGTLPKLLEFSSDTDRAQFLRAYALTYLKEEIAAEQVVRKLDPFRQFLEIAGQSNGKVINFSNIARDVGVDVKTVQSYFTILEDTLVGTLLPAYHTSVRRRQVAHPKFYLFDTGVKRALERTANLDLQPETYGFGDAFEHFVILEIMRLADYAGLDWQFSYLLTKDGAEIDLVIDRPGRPVALLEIKSAPSTDDRDVRTLNRFAPDFAEAERFCLSRDPHEKRIEGAWCLPWQVGIERLGL